MDMQIEAIASATGMSGIFKLRAADIYRVLSVETVPVRGATARLIPMAVAAHRTGTTLARTIERKAAELEILQRVSSEINSTLDLEEIYDIALRTMDELFEFHHAIILLVEPGGETLRVVASRGYENQAVGGRVRIGTGVIGIVAAEAQDAARRQPRAAARLRGGAAAADDEGRARRRARRRRARPRPAQRREPDRDPAAHPATS